LEWIVDKLGRDLKIVTITVASLFCFGCERIRPEAAASPNQVASSADGKEMLARVDAALKIGSYNDKDEALAAVCREAAKIGESEAVKKGVANISSLNLRDEVAADCAISLQASGKTPEATEIAEVISSYNKKDEVLKSLASGS
jgi:hypothetical protein